MTRDRSGGASGPSAATRATAASRRRPRVRSAATARVAVPVAFTSSTVGESPRGPQLRPRPPCSWGVPAAPATLPRTLLLALLALLALAAPAHASHAQTTSFEAPRDLLDPATRSGALDEIEGLGVTSLRVVLPWRAVAPAALSATKPAGDATDPAFYAWGQYDALLTDARARGLSVLLTVSGPVPRWATEARRDTLTRPRPTEFARFMTAVGRQFGGRVATWSIWNEPNQPQFLLPQYDARHRPVCPRLYRALYLAGLKGLGAAGLRAPRVLLGETSPRGTGRVVAPLTFLRGVLCLDSRNRRQRGCARLPAAGIAHHAYTTRAGPRFVPPGPNDVTIGVLGRLTRLVDAAGRTGALPRGLPLHLTEFGIQSAPDPIFGVSLQRQEEYRALSERIAWANPRVRTFSQYLLRDDEPLRSGPRSARYPGFESGLRTAAGRAKPALDGFRVVLSALRTGSRVSLWGLVRPAHAVTTARLEERAGARGPWRALATVRTDARGALSRRTAFVAGRQYRLRWRSPAGVERASGPIRPLR